jgi:hypothetical protein
MIYFPLFRIRIRFQLGSVDPDPDCESGSGSLQAKIDFKKENK